MRISLKNPHPFPYRTSLTSLNPFISICPSSALSFGRPPALEAQLGFWVLLFGFFALYFKLLYFSIIETRNMHPTIISAYRSHYIHKIILLSLAY